MPKTNEKLRVIYIYILGANQFEERLTTLRSYTFRQPIASIVCLGVQRKNSETFIVGSTALGAQLMMLSLAKACSYEGLACYTWN